MLRTCLVLASSLLATAVAWAQQVAPSQLPAVSAPAAETESQKLARTKLMDMAKFLSRQEKFSATMRVGYEVLQASGQKIEFGEIRDLAVQRPNRVRVSEQQSDGWGNVMMFDGKTITLLDGDTGTYAQVPQPGDIDHTVTYYVRDLKMRLPLAPLLMVHFPEEMQGRIENVDYVERTNILGEPAHHIAARTANVDFQVWIADGKRPLPLRIVLNYRKEPGHPQFWAQFSKWNLAPQFTKTTFEFKPPKGAEQILFAVQVPPLAGVEQAGGTQKQGDKQ
jgi:hypothetical protein